MAGMRTSVKKISLKSSSPAMSRIGRTSMPGVFRLRTKAVIPSCFFPRSMAVGSVRSRNSPQVARWAEEIQIFEPLTTYSSVVGVVDRRRAQVGQVVAGHGLAEALAPVLLGLEDGRQPLRLLLLGAPLDDHRPDLPDPVGVEHARRAVLGHHLGVEEALHGVDGAPVGVLGAPVDGGPPALVQLALPLLPTLLAGLAATGWRRRRGTRPPGTAAGARRARPGARRGTSRPRVPGQNPRGKGSRPTVYCDAGVRDSRRGPRDRASRRTLTGEAVDFTYDDEQLALQEVARARARARVRARAAAPAGRRPDRHHARRCGPRWSISAGPACWCPTELRRQRAPACSRCASSLEQMGRIPLPGPVLLRPPWRPRWPPAPSAPPSCSPTWPPAPAAAPSPSASRGTASRSAPCGPGPAARARAVGAERREARGGRRAHRRLGHRGGPQRGGRALVPARVARRRRRRPVELVPSLDPTRKLARLVLEDTPVVPLGPPGNQAGLWQRVQDDIADRPGGRDRRRGRPGPDRGHRLHVGADRLRQAGGHVPDGAPSPGRDVPAGRDGPGRLPVRRLGLGHRGARAGPGRGHGRRATPPRPACG